MLRKKIAKKMFFEIHQLRAGEDVKNLSKILSVIGVLVIIILFGIFYVISEDLQDPICHFALLIGYLCITAFLTIFFIVLNAIESKPETDLEKTVLQIIFFVRGLS